MQVDEKSKVKTTQLSEMREMSSHRSFQHRSILDDSMPSRYHLKKQNSKVHKIVPKLSARSKTIGKGKGYSEKIEIRRMRMGKVVGRSNGGNRLM